MGCLMSNLLPGELMSLILNTAIDEPEPLDVAPGPALADGYNATRRHERTAVDFPVKIFVRGKAGTMGRCSDLGVGGMGFYAPLELALDEEVHLHFTLPYSRIAFGISALVRDVKGFRYGVEFERLTLAESAELERIVKILGLPIINHRI